MSPPDSKLCAGCRSTIKKKDFLECQHCGMNYDLVCSGVTPSRFRAMNAQCKMNWKCPECLAKQPKKDNTNTPVHQRTVSASSHLSKAPSSSSSTNDCDSHDANVTLRTSRRRSRESDDFVPETETPDKHSNSKTTFEPNFDDMSEIIRREVSAAMSTQLPSLMEKLFERNFNPIKAQLDILQDSVKFMSDQYEDFKDSVHAIINENKALKAECTQLRETVNNLADRLNMMEQYMRDSNLEIQGVPEFKTENVVSVIKQVAKVVSVKLLDEDILSCTRVAAMNKKGQRPRAIVVKLKSSRCRDEMYSAVRRFNKDHPNEKLNSSHLGIAGEKTNIYVCEHLSPANKALHAAARIKSRELGYKFIWVRNGHIFVRKDENSRFIHIKNLQTVSSLE